MANNTPKASAELKFHSHLPSYLMCAKRCFNYSARVLSTFKASSFGSFAEANCPCSAEHVGKNVYKDTHAPYRIHIASTEAFPKIP